MTSESYNQITPVKLPKYYWRTLSPLWAIFLFIEFALRLTLIRYQRVDLNLSALDLLQIFGFGALRDLGVFAYLVPIIGLIYAFRRYRERFPDAAIAFVFYFVILFTTVAEYLFWDEFQTRCNFIAVDCLIYTREAVANIRESYSLGTSLPTIAAASLFMAWLQWRRPQRITRAPLAEKRWKGLLCLVLGSAFVAGVSYAATLPSLNNRYADEIAKNGIAELFAAFNGGTQRIVTFRLNGW